MSPHEEMVGRVAVALGPDLAKRTAFVGGCATALLVTDELAREGIRFTDDVDVIVHVLGYGDWYALEGKLADKGFRVSGQDEVACRRRLRDGGSELIVDFMPDDARILGFTNRWYSDALETAETHLLSTGVEVRVVAAPYFIGTKLEAYLGRGGSNPMASRDVEDIVSILDGRDTLVAEIAAAPGELRDYISRELRSLSGHRDFEYVVQSLVRGSDSRETAIFQRIAAIIE